MNNTFDQWYASKYYGHPWEPKKEALREAWEAGVRHEATLKAAADEVYRPVHEKPHVHESVNITPEAIYAAYPRKVGKQAALKAIKRAEGVVNMGSAVGGSYPYLLEKTRAYADAVAKWPDEDKKFIPHPATWFNQGRYDDDPKEWQRGKPEGQYGNAF